MIVSFDRKRMVELTRALSPTHEFKLGKTRVHPDASIEFPTTPGDKPVLQRTLVRLTRWNRWSAAAADIERFAADLRQFEDHYGILIASGGFAPTAVQAARRARIENVDAGTMALRLNEMPPERGDFYFDMATAGDPATPSCPCCLKPLKLFEDSPGWASAFLHLPDLRYRTSDIVADAVAARRVEILPHCEVQFLREVRTQELVVHGKVTGDFICEGSVVLHPGAMLQGSVAARSVEVRPGADLLDETRILEGKLGSAGKSPPTLIWRCSSGAARPGCKAVAFLPHEESGTARRFAPVTTQIHP